VAVLRCRLNTQHRLGSGQQVSCPSLNPRLSLVSQQFQPPVLLNPMTPFLPSFFSSIHPSFLSSLLPSIHRLDGNTMTKSHGVHAQQDTKPSRALQTIFLSIHLNTSESSFAFLSGIADISFAAFLYRHFET